ncbi:hypothetical protein [Hymenobacter cellulosilyticus]|uniref:Uncharacterized protein n=1 Tax=Hymenobacter cellulosilyticus TaxID=2932248 RepID=A0A8T9Q910_9BACT|nr:hypothetical protein [Hymenobacter cellulosilyticus]UOQ74027.1 hypothetical protein MUN79_09100 [Hymenobacter cellulosilyticus]
MLTTKQDNRLTAAENVAAALTQDATPYAHDKALQQISQQLTVLLDALRPLRQKGIRTASQGSTKTKGQRREQLATSAAEVAGDLYSYATDQQNRALQTSADYNYSSFRKMRATALTDLVQHLYDEAETHQQALLDYGLTPARLQELKDALTAFTGTKNEPRQHITEGKAARILIKDQFSQLATLLEDRLDRSLRKYARSAPTFYHRLTAARQVIDRPGKQQGGTEDPSTNP